MVKFIFVFLLSTSLFAQDNSALTGVLNYDSKIALENSPVELKPENNESVRKSPLLAGLLSAALPGAGEFYVGDYWKSFIFVGIEAAAITFKVLYDQKGDDQTVIFEDYAHQHWSVERYAQWSVANAERINPDIFSQHDNSILQVFENGAVNWDRLNSLERAIGNYYSHTLERFGEQQYYEMIGKYPQFNPGWDDFDESKYPDGMYDYTNGPDSDPVTDKFEHYSGLRGEANDFYNVASKAVIVIIVNHIASIVDAAISANSFNKRVEISSDIQKVNFGYRNDYIQRLNLKISF
ncbi:MAG: hypothetical protein K9G44_01705 [Melioribacteraceae bacterium]|nr:hypothetical protein [Melioribacteraceae bacterium]